VAADDHEPVEPSRRKERPWFLDPRAIIAFLGALVALILGLTQLLKQLDDPPAQVSVEYIVDVSRGMKGRIGPEEKLPAAAAEVVSHVQDQPSLSTALRLSGPACTQGYKEPDVSFAEDNSDAFSDAFEGLQPRGGSDFVSAVEHAVDDFSGRSDAAQSKTKSLFIFVGGRDTCTDQPRAEIGRALRTLAASEQVQLNLKFIGVSIPPELRGLLRSVGRLTRRLDYTSEVVVADTPEQLKNALPGQNDCSSAEVAHNDPC
jgi:hypothetical protein